MTTMPVQKPGRSIQAVGTPDDFLAAFELRFGEITFDLSATPDNCVRNVPHFGPGSFYSEDALIEDWSVLRGNLWLNPPFAKIGPWAKKAGEGGNVNLIVPLSSSKWSAKYCWGVGMVYPLFPRLIFKGHVKPYPKDMMLVRYGLGYSGCELWRWK